ncbi:hypothetical protein BY458DRAFT_429086 [Sporodiniella umbellata]|nr:hypothetical protein BY458DRAFT_429086 [Sporodiniella umbellata]
MRNIQHEIKEAEEATREPPNSDTSEIENSIVTIKLMREIYRVEDMKNVRNIRLEALRSRHSDTFKAYEWLKENKDQFSAKVYSPILLEINLKDSQYAAHIEQVLGGFRSNIFRTFLFESKEDYLKFNRIMITERKLRVTTAWPGEFSKDVLKTPSTTEELRNKFKFEYYIADLIRAPDFVLKYLCLENKINLIPVSLQQVEEERIVNSGIFKRFTAAQNHYRVKNSRYSDSYQTEVTVLRPAQLLNDSVDIELKNSLIDKMKTHHSNILQCEQDTKEVVKEVEDINQVIRELEFEKSDLQSKKRDVTIAAQKYERTKNLLRQKKSELAELESEPEADQQNVERLKEKKSLLLDEESQHLSRFTLLSKELLDVLKKSNQKQIEQVEAMARFDRLKSYIRDQSAALEEAQKSLEGFKRQYDYLAQRVTGYMNQAREAGQELTGELKEAFKEIITQFKEGGETEFSTLEELSLKIAEKEGEAAAISYNDPNAMKHYEERVAQIEKLNRKIEKDKAGMEKLESKITQLRERWEPRIDQLVRSISENFTNAFESIIGCTGEVGIDKQEDFDKWGIQILVKFRDTEKLQILTSQRQSGGERSVATSLYLMSLQNLAKSPFRVVDEINQGMDPRNERMIHKRIVEGASRSGTSQYFLITPKLLPDLHYNEQVRVLCIHNGEWIPVKMNPVAKYLEHARKNPALIH